MERIPVPGSAHRSDRGRPILGIAALVLQLLILLPVPDALFDALVIPNPYL